MRKRKVVKHDIIVRMDRIRRARGIGYQFIAHHTGLSHGHVWNIFNGSIVSPLYSTVCRIVRVLDMDDVSIVEQTNRSARIYKLRY